MIRAVSTRALLLSLLIAGASLVRAQTRDPYAAIAAPETRLLLLFFVSSDCPVSNRYFPEMERLRIAYARQGVRTRYIYPNEGERADNVQQHQAEFGSRAEDAALDSGGELTRSVKANTTPEAAIVKRMGSGWRVLYVGRIDDRYVHIGLERAHAEHHDLELALDAATHGRAVPLPGGPPVGCAIVPHGSGAAAMPGMTSSAAVPR